MKIAINGMGRIGRLLFRRLIGHNNIELVAINDIMDPENLRYLMHYDSIYGTAPFRINEADDGWSIDGKLVRHFKEANPAALPWKELGIDLVIECTGMFTSLAAAGEHIRAGAKKVILSTTGKPDVPLFIYGHNSTNKYVNEPVFAAGGCMTNCTVPIINLLQQHGIESLHIHVIHSYTSRQSLVDGAHPDFRRGRAAAESMIPVKVDLGDSLERIFPSLEGKISTITTRVPVANGAIANFSFVMRSATSAEAIGSILSAAASSELKGVLAITNEQLVSSDIKGNSHSAIIDMDTISVTGRQVNIQAFFDNEYGYTSRVIDWLGLLVG